MAEIATVAYRAGLRTQSGLQAAVAIAMAESGGNPNAEGDKALQNATWGPSVGLWQIRSLKAESGKGTARDVTRLKDPAFNAQSMMSISRNGVDWGPWTTWPLRAAPYMPAAALAARGVLSLAPPVDTVTGGIDAVTGSLADVGTGVRATHRWISDRNNWIRVAKVAAGAGLLIGGVLVLARPAVSSAAGKAASILPKGKA